MPNYIAGNGVTIENNIISSKTTSTSEIGSFKVDGSTIYIDSNNVIHGKKEQKITLSDTTLEINVETTTVTVTEHIGDGTLSVSSSDTDVVTASISDNTITVTGVDSGEATITVTASATSLYQEATATISVTVQAVQIYGAEWDGSSNPAWTRTDGAVGFADPNPYYSGMSETPSSPFDNIMPWAGMQIVEGANAGTLVEIPKFWYKWTKNGTAMKLQITADADTATANNFLCSPAHADRGDGVGERDYVYVGRYHCAPSYLSRGGQIPAKSYTRDQFRMSIHNLGTNTWQNDFAMWWTIRMLYLVEFAHWNSQLKIGYGCGNNSSVGTTGYTDSMPYHTGTTRASRTTYGLGTQYRYIEGLWDNVWDWIDGIFFSSYDAYVVRNPSNFRDSITSGAVKIGQLTSSTGYVKAWTIPSVQGYEYALHPTTVGSSLDGTTYVSDYWNFNFGTVLCAGGYYSQSQLNGAFYLYDYGSATSKAGYIGSRLMVLPPSRLTS